jgi:hypothetical protein
MYDVLYVTQSPKENVTTVEDLFDDSFPLTYDQLKNRIIFFYTNYDIRVNVNFNVNGGIIKMGEIDFPA